MNRDFLKGLGLEKDVINEIMKAHGLVIQEPQKSLDAIESDNARLKQENEGYRLNDLKREIAIEYKLPVGASKYLVGRTESELHEDAKKMTSYINKPPLLNFRPSTGEETIRRKSLLSLIDGAIAKHR